jgi:hypothetical protein
VKIGRNLRFAVSVPMTDLPLMGFHLLMVLTLTRVWNLRSTAITRFRSLWSVARSKTPYAPWLARW